MNVCLLKIRKRWVFRPNRYPSNDDKPLGLRLVSVGVGLFRPMAQSPKTESKGDMKKEEDQRQIKDQLTDTKNGTLKYLQSGEILVMSASVTPNPHYKNGTKQTKKPIVTVPASAAVLGVWCLVMLLTLMDLSLWKSD